MDFRYPIAVSLDLVESLHSRWCARLRLQSDRDLQREFVHPVFDPVVPGTSIANHEWQGRHHLARIASLAVRQSW